MRPMAGLRFARTSAAVRTRSNANNNKDLSPEHVARFKAELIDAHRDNISRYGRLLQTQLTDVERHFLQRRLAEEGVALCNLLRVTIAHLDPPLPDPVTDQSARPLLNSARLASVPSHACELGKP